MSQPPALLAAALAALFAAAPAGMPAKAASGCARDAMLVFDGSASMAEVGFDVSAPTRIEEARQAVARAMPRIAPVRRVGLLTYGPGGADACSGIALRFPPMADAAEAVTGGVVALRPNGLTPIAASVQAAADVLGGEGIVVLVTDGNETCGGRPCALGGALAQTAPGITVHVIGFRVEYDPFAWDSPEAGVYSGAASVAKCLSDQTGGLYVGTETVDELAAALEETLGCALIGLRREKAAAVPYG
ncbi:MAG: VWA domain-containing protein [Roseovarius sp.]